jgi:hypothetical protein
MQIYKNETSNIQFWIIYNNIKFNSIQFGSLHPNKVLTTGQKNLEIVNSEQELSDRLGILSGDIYYYINNIQPNQISSVSTSGNEIIYKYRETLTATPWKFRLALNRLGLRDQIEIIVKNSTQDIKDGWDYATSFDRLNTFILQLGKMLNMSYHEVDEIFFIANEIV